MFEEVMSLSYRLQVNEKLPQGIIRIAHEQIDDALSYLQSPEDDLDEAVHESRKCFKKVRGLLRLLRKEIGEEVYQRENVCFRDAGRRLSDLRDSAVNIKTLDDVRERDDLDLAPDHLESMREALVIFYHATRQRVVEEEQGLAKTADMIQAARHRVVEWPVEEDSFAAVSGGLKKVYKRGRNRLEDALEEPSIEAFHEWRKRVKYLWYNVRILRPIWPDLMETLADEIHDLSDYLGDAHDLAMLQQLVVERPSLLPHEDDRSSLITYLEQQRDKLHTAAYQQGRRTYTESPKAFVNRLEAYWAIIK
mgnify:CR=1 FL=1